MIGQVTDLAIKNIGGWKYYLVFCVCNFTNAIFFWLVLPETTKRPLEEMNDLFTHEPWLVPGTQTKKFRQRAKLPAIQAVEKKLFDMEHEEAKFV